MKLKATFTDVWLLQALFIVKPEASLSEFIASADYINHAIPTSNEINQFLNLMTKLELIERTELFYTLKNSISKEINNLTEKYRSLDKVQNMIKLYLEKCTIKNQNNIENLITEDQVELAYQNYIKNLRSKNTNQ